MARASTRPSLSLLAAGLLGLGSISVSSVSFASTSFASIGTPPAGPEAASTPASDPATGPQIADTQAVADLPVPQFFAQLDDVPLPTGFSELDTQIAFAASSGRIERAQAKGPAGADGLDFLIESLPQLGWSRLPPEPETPMSWVRGRDILRAVQTQDETGVVLDVNLVARGPQTSLD